MLIWEDHWQVQWFLGNHCEFGFEVTIANFQWFLRRPSPLNIFRQSDHCYQWFFNGFWFCYHRFQWFSMVQYHWSNDAMVSMDRCGLIHALSGILNVAVHPSERRLWLYGEESGRLERTPESWGAFVTYLPRGRALRPGTPVGVNIFLKNSPC